MIKKIRTEETYFIRKKILRKGTDKPCQFNGDFDDKTFHLGAYKQNKLVGIATFMKQSNNLLFGSQYQLRGMATLSEVRGLGFGNLLLETAFEKLKKKNVEYLWCNAREVAVKFYQKNGFEILGTSFEIEGIGTHFKMCKKLE